ncbi:MAG: hypothetical protein ACRDFB_09830 [Rhabdochlamydiaceae bacterium]
MERTARQTAIELKQEISAVKTIISEIKGDTLGSESVETRTILCAPSRVRFQRESV